MTVSLSKRVQKVKPSPTLAMTARAAKLKAEGKDVIGLAAGEPDFDTPAHISDAGVEAIRKGITRYTAVDGTAELKDAIIAKFKRDNGHSPMTAARSWSPPGRSRPASTPAPRCSIRVMNA